MLSACMSVVVDGEWRMSLAAVMGKQLDLYKEYPEEKVSIEGPCAVLTVG